MFLVCSPISLDEKSVKQLISVLETRIADGITTFVEFGELLGEFPAERIVQDVDQCSTDKFRYSGLALRDSKNVVCRRLGIAKSGLATSRSPFAKFLIA